MYYIKYVEEILIISRLFTLRSINITFVLQQENTISQTYHKICPVLIRLIVCVCSIKLKYYLIIK